MKIETRKTKELKPFLTREIRKATVDSIKASIAENGYLQGHTITIVDDMVVDGNHRHVALQELGIESVVCACYENGEVNIYKLAEQLNASNETYAKQDLFDVLYKISKLKANGNNGKEIADVLGWSQALVSQYNNLNEKLFTSILEKCKACQTGRVNQEFTQVNFDFTEGFFRTSGLYDLSEKYQQLFFDKFKSDGFNWNKSKVQQTTAKYKLWQEMTEYAVDKLGTDELTPVIENSTFANMEQLTKRVDDMLKKQKNKLIQGDSVIELAKLDDGLIDVVITDAPYGVDYTSNRSKFAEHVAKEAIANDTEEAFDLLDRTCWILDQKTKHDAHLYFFTSWKVYSGFESIISKYFEIKNMLVWDKGNHSMGDLTGAWGNRHELIIFATKGNRPINTRKADILSANRVSTQNAIHPTQKPEELIKQLLDVSAINGDVICDPFMGSGSTIKAVKQYSDKLNYIGIELDKERFEKARAYIG